MPAINHCLPIYCKLCDDGLVLNEGMAMNWFSVRELNYNLPVVPVLWRMFPRLKIF